MFRPPRAENINSKAGFIFESKKLPRPEQVARPRTPPNAHDFTDHGTRTASADGARGAGRNGGAVRLRCCTVDGAVLYGLCWLKQ